MTGPSNSDSKTSSKSSNTLIIILVIIIIALIAVIVYVLISNNRTASTDGDSIEPPQIDLPTQLPSGPSVTALEPINIRSGPGVDYPSYGVAPAGSVGEVIGISSDGGWWVIKLSTNIAQSGQGWVSADYVKAENVGEPPVIDAPPLP